MVTCAYWQPSDWCDATKGATVQIKYSAFGGIRLCARHLVYWEDASSDRRTRLL